MTIVLPLTILITVIEMIVDFFAPFSLNVDCKDVYAKPNCAEINVWGGEGGRRGSRATSFVFLGSVSTIVTGSVGVITVSAYFLSLIELSRCGI